MYLAFRHTHTHTSPVPHGCSSLSLQTVSSTDPSSCYFSPFGRSKVMSTRDLFLCCAWACVCVSIFLSMCARLHVSVLTAHKSVSSFRHRDPEHALLPVSLWLASSPEGAQDSSYNAPFSDLYTSIQCQKAWALTAAIFTCTCRKIHIHGCKETRGSVSAALSLSSHIWLCMCCGVTRFKDVAACWSRREAWHT